MPMTGAERVAKHRQRQVDRIAQLERELADLKNQHPVSNDVIDEQGLKRFSAETVARVLGVTEATVLSAVEDGLLSAKDIEGQLFFDGIGVGIKKMRDEDLTYTALMQRALELAVCSRCRA